MGQRLYDPGTGRFLQVTRYQAAASNAYDYAGQDPVNSST